MKQIEKYGDTGRVGPARLARSSLASALDGQGRLVGQGDPAAQVRQVFRNLAAALVAAGAAMDQVVKLTVYLTDLDDLDAFRRVRDEYVPRDRPPASSLVRVSGLINPEFRVEIEALAAI